MRLIDADAIEWGEQLVPYGNGKYEYMRIAYMDDIDDLPTVKPERKKGKWVFVHPLQIDDSGAYMCSECKMGMWEIIPSVYHYCPNCGADMRGGQDED